MTNAMIRNGSNIISLFFLGTERLSRIYKNALYLTSNYIIIAFLKIIDWPKKCLALFQAIGIQE